MKSKHVAWLVASSFARVLLSASVAEECLEGMSRVRFRTEHRDSEIIISGSWNQGSVNKKLVRIYELAQSMKREGNELNVRFVAKDGETEITTSGDPAACREFIKRAHGLSDEKAGSAPVWLVPSKNVRYTQSSVGKQKVEEKRETAAEQEPSPAYRLNHPRTGKVLIAVLDGHHRVASHLRQDDRDGDTLVPLRFLSEKELRDRINAKYPALPNRWPRALMEEMIWEHLEPAGKPLRLQP